MLKIYNSLTRKIETVRPMHPLQIGMYTCGPTVYQFAHIGNFRAYMTADILVRTLIANGLDVNFVMNITDVGHMTADQTDGGDGGEDKVEKTARLEGKTVWEVAKFYTDVFLSDYEKLNLTIPTVLSKATDHIKEQISLIQEIENKGYTYATSDGIYFDTSKLTDYGKMSDMALIKEGSSMEVNTEKKNPRDFALWKLSPDGQKRQMEWDSPWGVGFPGWHIECSAMSMKYLGKTFDIHTGGIDHKEIHHPNEIAQAEVVTNAPLANYWVHNAFMQVTGEKMSKSIGNTYTLYDLEKEGYDPMALRYLYLQTHYRKDLNFTFPSLDAAASAYRKIVEEVSRYNEPEGRIRDLDEKFIEAINDDLNTPQALAVLWEVLKSDQPAGAKAGSIFKMDQVLGLKLREKSLTLRYESGNVPDHIRQLVKARKKLRGEKHFNLADKMRVEIEKLGYDIEDTPKGTQVRKKIPHTS